MNLAKLQIFVGDKIPTGKLDASGSSELHEMREMLRRHGYPPAAADSLHAEGMGPFELETRLREKGGLERTHGVTRKAGSHGLD